MKSFLIGREGDSLRVIDEKMIEEAKRWRSEERRVGKECSS